MKTKNIIISSIIIAAASVSAHAANHNSAGNGVQRSLEPQVVASTNIQPLAFLNVFKLSGDNGNNTTRSAGLPSKRF